MRYRLPLLAACLAVAITAKAQTKFDQSGLWDNWYVGANVGFNSKLTHNAFLSHLNPHATIRVGRDIIPIVGVMVEVTPFFNDQKFPAGKELGQFYYSHTAVKALDFDLLGNLNLHNLFKGYEGEPRFFEAHFIAGIGLNHAFGVENVSKNAVCSKIGFDFSFMLGQNKEWEAYVEPAMNFNLNRYSNGIEFNPNCAAWQLAVGVNYRLNNIRKPRYAIVKDAIKAPVTSVKPTPTVPAVTQRTPVTPQTSVAKEKPVTPATVTPVPTTPAKPVAVTPTTETPATPVTVTPVPTTTPTKTATPATSSDTDQPATATAKTKGKPTSKNTVPAGKSTSTSNTALPAIHFKTGNNNIPDDQYDALAQIATYLKNRPRTQLVIKGQRARAEAVKNTFIRRFGINASRLSIATANTDTVTFSEK